MSSTVETTTEIRPFHVDIPEEQLDDLRRRIAATRWPSKELVADRSQGVQLATLQALARYWATDYDWRKAEAKLNALPQFTTEIDGVDIHFIHVKSPHENALPLIMTHGWPGSVIELLETIGPLTDPTAHGGHAEDAFHLVLPSLPGYGFSGEPTEVGWDSGRIARAWAELMGRLGYTRYVAQGGDVGAARHRRDGPPGARGAARHPHQPARDGAGRLPAPAESEEERAALGATQHVQDERLRLLPGAWPRGRRRSATPCWIHPSPWRPGCSTTTRTATTRSPAPLSTASPRAISPGTDPRQHHAVLADGHRGLGGPVVLGDRTSAGSGLRPARLLRRSRSRSASPRSPARSSRPRAAGSRQSYPNLTYFNEVDKGGHFAAWEEPELFSDEIRAAFRPSRRRSPSDGRRSSRPPFPERARTMPLASRRRGDRVAQLRAIRPCRAPRARRPRELLDVYLHQLAAHGAVRPCVVAAYRDDGLIVIGVHTPEFSFEHDLDLVRQATQERGIDYPVALDNDYGIWSAFDNHYWPALYFVDADGIIRDQHFGEGRYEESRTCHPAAAVEPVPRHASWSRSKGSAWRCRRTGDHLRYAGDICRLRAQAPELARSDAAPGARAAQPLGPRRRMDDRAGESCSTGPAEASPIASTRATSHLVLCPAGRHDPFPSACSSTARPRARSHGVDVDEDGNSVLRAAAPPARPRARHRRPNLEITFLGPGAEAYVFTFG